MKVAKNPLCFRIGIAAISFAALTLGSLSAVEAHAQSESGTASSGSAKALSDLMESEPEEKRLGWEPQLGFGFGVMTQSQNGKTTVPPNGPSFESRLIEDSGDSLISEFFDFSLYLYTPVQLDLPTKPRFILTSAFQLPIAEDLIANRLDTSFNRVGVESNPVAFSENCPEFMTDDDGNPILNSRTGAPIQPDTCSTVIRNRTTPLALWSFGVGTDFTLPFDEEQFHLVTTIDYVGMAIQGEGAYSRLTSSQRPEADPIKESIDVVGDAEIYHGLSASFRFAIDAYEQEAWTWQVYVSGRASYYFANKDLESAGSTDLGDFDFVSEVAGMQYQAFTGITVRFNPSWK